MTDELFWVIAPPSIVISIFEQLPNQIIVIKSEGHVNDCHLTRSVHWFPFRCNHRSIDNNYD